jgi:phytanoyl-CoA hydroxylase
MSAPDLDAYARDGFLVLQGFLPPADCDALQARAVELVASFDPGPVRSIFSTRDQGHAGDRYFQESGGAIRFFFEEGATDQPVPLALNKIGHALHDLDPVFDRISRQPRLAALARALGLVQPLLLQSMYLFKQPQIGAEVGWHQDATYLYTRPSARASAASRGWREMRSKTGSRSCNAWPILFSANGTGWSVACSSKKKRMAPPDSWK